ncbi:GDYXXLXY domain-containing protein [Lutibacter sp. TH_r2]|uniref:GDYXXLXY domain-containing protein n=1 Tax=Lutibacter sp. TH_r2 TaxID=3082083 RepID=UPI0029531A92|nr:GDYXXLXY domain-containing protein [Lutibacter sp. TH_r2]MDV7186387.1 GDYXXLXY domain-containing protein [Lutibacter sp. TH_r2]
MKSKTILFSLFILIVLVQLYIPLKMILGEEDVLTNGKEFKFETAPVDPVDPFRGKYISLRFKNNTFPIENKEDWARNEEVFVILKNNINGFAEIDTIVHKKPLESIDFIKTKVQYVYAYKKEKTISVKYPFERFYMEEFKAKEAELLAADTFKDTTKTIYASVFIKNGKAVLNNVFIDKIPIKDLVSKKEN